MWVICACGYLGASCLIRFNNRNIIAPYILSFTSNGDNERAYTVRLEAKAASFGYWYWYWTEV